MASDCEDGQLTDFFDVGPLLCVCPQPVPLFSLDLYMPGVLRLMNFLVAQYLSSPGAAGKSLY